MVLTIANKRRRLANANREAETESERLRAVLKMLGDRIREFKASILEKQKRTNAFREQVQEVNGRLIRVVREIRDRTENILTEYVVLIEEVVQVNLTKESQGTPNESDLEPKEDPEEEPVAPGEVVESTSSVMN